MAGIGFTLRRLTGQDDFTGIMRAYFHSALIAVGPWILAAISLGFISFFTTAFLDIYEINEFISVIIYNFFFSFILSAPLYMLASRYVADCLFRRDGSPIPGIFIVSLFYLVVPCLIIATIFYVFYATMSSLTTVLSILNFMFLCEIWFVMLFLSCIRNYSVITLAWVLSTVLTILGTIFLGKIYGINGLLFSFNLGLILILVCIKASILAEYPFRFLKPIDYKFYFQRYRGLFWSGFFLFSGMWIDKIIMWSAPEATLHANNLQTYPIYDGAMFISYLSIIPVMALFIFSLETNFYDSYIQYIRNIEINAPIELINTEKKNMETKILENGRSFLVLQGSLTMVIIVLAPTIFKWLGIDYLELGIFRFGTLGAFFCALNLFIIVFFSYFDSQENTMLLSAIMLISNATFTLFFKQFGFFYYGYGYCFSMILSFLIGSTLFVRFLHNLNYHIFISNVIKRQKFQEKSLEQPPEWKPT